MYPYPKTASMVTMVAMVGNSVGKSAKKSVAKFWSTSWSLQTLEYFTILVQCSVYIVTLPLYVCVYKAYWVFQKVVCT